LNDKSFEKLATLAYTVASRQIASGEEASILDSISVDHLQTKQIYSGLLTFAHEASRHDAKKQDIISFLEERMSKERIELVIEIHDKFATSVRSVLARSSINFSSIVDLRWRLDYFVQSNLLEQNRSLLYFISLTTRDPDGKLDSFEFRATLEDLQELLTKCREALNVVKNIHL